MPSSRSLLRSVLCTIAIFAAPAWALGAAPFDLEGPQLQVTVTRGGRTLPIAEAPNLAAGDRLSIKANLPSSQSAPYLLVAAFLRGATNPPPEKWFFQSRTWDPKDKAGLAITVPDGAQQLLVFLAPRTGGDFNTLRGAVRGRPGAFVRAAQDLRQASLDHGRLAVYLSAVGAIAARDPAALKTASPLLARSLAIKLDPDCLQKALDAQATCLTQGQESLILDDGHSTSMMQALTSGDSAELVQQLSATPKAGGGYFSPYVSSVLDIAHILNSFGTAQYQYIPALTTLSGDHAALLLNAPPSFQNPKSVLVVAMPAIGGAPPPPLHVLATEDNACLQKPDLVLSADGAPLMFSTAYAHDLVLRIAGKDGRAVNLPLRADPEKGGLALEDQSVDAGNFGPAVQGQVRGGWGFDAYAGPRVVLQSGTGAGWRLAAGDQQTLVAGRKVTAHLDAAAPACVKAVSLETDAGPSEALSWKTDGAGRLTVEVPLGGAQPGPASLLISQFGQDRPQAVAFTVYPASRIQAFAFHEGDGSGVLTGSELDDVASLKAGGVVFRPDAAPAVSAALTLVAADPDAAQQLKAGQTAEAQVTLKDGRTIPLTVVVGPPRPAVRLLAKSLRDGSPDQQLKIGLGDADELPRDRQLTFSIQAQGSTVLTDAKAVEVAAASGGDPVELTAAGGGFTLQNGQVAVATVDLGTAFGPSAFGPLRFRVVSPAGASDWQPLGTMVRLPRLRRVDCPSSGGQPCQLEGSDLFLISEIADNPGFVAAVQVPAGFPGNSLQIPRPRDGKLYVRLSDDPAVSNIVTPPLARTGGGVPDS